MPLPDIRPDHIDLVQQILQQHVPHAQVWVFGSRAKWTARDTSDLDLCISANAALSFEQMGALREAFENSNLPYKVDVVDWATTSEAFRAIIDQSKVPLPMAGDETVKVVGGAVCRRGGVMGEWETEVVELSKVAIITSGKRPLVVSKEQTAKLQIPVVGGGGQSGYTDKALLQERALITGRVGTLGKLHAIYQPCWPSDNALVVAPSSSATDWNFLRYALELRIAKAADMNRGAANPLITQKDLGTLQIFYPSLSTQKAIAAVLSALDDKIELNRRMNETLEASARALFRDWFVDFGPVKAKAANAPATLAPEIWFLFPAQLDDEGKPEGWKWAPLTQFADVNQGRYLSKDAMSDSYCDANTTPVHGANGIIGWSTKPMYENGQTLITCRGSNSGMILWADGPLWVSNNAMAVSPRNGCTWFSHFQLLIDPPFDSVSGSAQPQITHTALASRNYLKPTDEVCRAFDEIVKPLMAKATGNRDESRTLAQTRDRLLPKLMSGEIRVADAARALENAAGMAL